MKNTLMRLQLPTRHLTNVVAFLFFIACADVAVAESVTKPCRVSGIPRDVQCGFVTRPLNPAAPDGVKIRVHYVVIPAEARNKNADPVFFFAGGPGQSAIKIAPKLAPAFARFSNRRDLVFVDQRGTGKSAALTCDRPPTSSLNSMVNQELIVAQIMQCKEALQKLPYGDLRFYTTTIAMQDFDAIRLALGYSKINAIGGSYGTRAILEFMRQYPLSIRRAVIDGVAPPDMVLPISPSQDAQAALDAIFTDCAADALCSKTYPSLKENWQQLLASLPRNVQVTHPVTGRTEAITITRDVLVGLLRGPLYVPTYTALLPSAINAAANGIFEPLFGAAAAMGSSGDGMSMGMHFSVVCAEDYPLMERTAAPTAVQDMGRDFGDQFAQMYRQVCSQWPRGSVPDAFYKVGSALSPVLVLSGGIDPVTPPRHGAAVAQALGSNARHIVVPKAGHGVMTIGCMRDVLFKFIDFKGDMTSANDPRLLAETKTQCVESIPRPSVFVPLADRLSKVLP